MEIVTLIILGFLFIILFEFLNKILKFVIYSPVYIYLLFSLITISVSILYFNFYPLEKKISLYNLDYITDKEFYNTIKFYLITINAFTFGVLLYHFASGGKTRELFKYKFQSSVAISIGSEKTIKKIATILLVSVVALFLIGYGPKIFIRNEYIPKNGMNSVILLSKLLSLVLSFILGIMNKNFPKLAKIYFLLLMLFAIGIGSRIAFVFLMLFIILSFNDKPKTRKNNFLFFLNIILALFFFAYLIQLRKVTPHGIIPYVSYIFESFEQIFDFFVFNLYYVIIFGVFVSAETISDGIINWNTILVSLNPLPGSMVGWYDFAQELRVNKHCPYSSNGEVFTMGVMFTIVFYSVLGAVFGYFERNFRQLLLNKRKIAAFILLLLLLLHIAYSFEYNLRSTVRYIYYSIFILIVFKFFKILKRITFTVRKT